MQRCWFIRRMKIIGWARLRPAERSPGKLWGTKVRREVWSACVSCCPTNRKAPLVATPDPKPRPRSNLTFLGRLPRTERAYIADALRTETVGGMLLLVAAVAALVWANTPLSGSYESVSSFHLGPGALGLHLSVGHWAADGLIAVFFFVAGIELKRELVTGTLRDLRVAALPIVAALCGMAVPALVYALVNAVGNGSMDGWAVPTATDIAFALAVLAVIGTSLPSALRAFLLTLAVVDDLFAILIIAVFFAGDIDLVALGGAALGLAVFWLLLRWAYTAGTSTSHSPWSTGRLMYNSGVHATIAGVAMGLMLRCTRREGESHSPVSTSNTWSVRSRPESPCRCSPCSPPGYLSPAARSAMCSAGRKPWEWYWVWSSVRRSASSAAPG